MLDTVRDDDAALLLVCSVTVFAGRLTKTFFVWVKLQLDLADLKEPVECGPRLPFRAQSQIQPGCLALTSPLPLSSYSAPTLPV